MISLEPQTSEIASQSFSELTVPAVSAYFETFNQADFQATAKLFTAAGQLHPPFEEPIIGREAIAAYLEAEAKGMQALPKTFSMQALDSAPQVEVIGKVQTPLFGVNIRWQFMLNSQLEITSVTIKLLAALPDLLAIKKNKETERSIG